MKYLKEYENWINKFTTQFVFDTVEYDDYDLYPGYSQPIKEDVEYYFDSKELAYQYAEEVKSLFESLPDPIPVYRAIKVKDKKDIDYEFLGESWSFDKESALNFGSRNMSNVLLSGYVKKEDVNWFGTFKVYHIFSGGYTDEDENEIVIDESDKIFNITVEDM